MLFNIAILIFGLLVCRLLWIWNHASPKHKNEYLPLYLVIRGGFIIHLPISLPRPFWGALMTTYNPLLCLTVVGVRAIIWRPGVDFAPPKILIGTFSPAYQKKTGCQFDVGVGGARHTRHKNADDAITEEMHEELGMDYAQIHQCLQSSKCRFFTPFDGFSCLNMVWFLQLPTVPSLDSSDHTFSQLSWMTVQEALDLPNLRSDPSKVLQSINQGFCILNS